jgi:hypothetical protein
MDDQKAHIRDFLAMTPDDLQKGRVTGKTLCGMDDPDHTRLTFANAESVVERSIKGWCERCRNRYIAEYTGSANRKARQAFRGVVANLFNGRRARGR